MVLIIVSQSILTNGAMPDEVRDHISPDVWLEITKGISTADLNSNMYACLIETCVCICLAFPCIFCCHPCVAMVFVDTNRTEQLNAINRKYFYGRPVLTTTDSLGIMINTDHIQPHVIDYATAEFVSPTSVTVVSPLVNSTDHPPEVAAMIIDDSRLPTVPTIQPASQERFIVVAIPQGAEAGAILDIQAPDGSMVSAVVPPDAYPGQEIRVAY